MKKKGTGFFKTVRYICMVFVIAFGLMTIIGTGGGGGDGGGVSSSGTTPVTFEKTFGSSYSDYGRSVDQGSYVIAGSYEGGGGGGSGNCQGVESYHCSGNVYLVKTDTNGNLLWEKTFGGTDCDRGFSVQRTSDDGYIIAGDTESYGAGFFDVYLVKTDANGDLLWEKTFGGADYDKGYSVRQTSDDGFIITGWTNSSGAGGTDVYLIKTDAEGNASWEKTFGGTNDDQGYSVQETSDGGYIITGTTNSQHDPCNTEYDVYLIKTDANGNLLWEKRFGKSSAEHTYEQGLSVQETSDGGYIISGSTSSFDSDARVTISDVYLIKTDANGNLLWEKTFGGSDNDSGSSVQETSDGGYIISGSTWSSGAGGSDVYLIKTDADGNV